jgi:hypothetical protein
VDDVGPLPGRWYVPGNQAGNTNCQEDEQRVLTLRHPPVRGGLLGDEPVVAERQLSMPGSGRGVELLQRLAEEYRPAVVTGA